MSNDDSSFAATLRRLREERKIGLRKFAHMVGMSPTYLSKVERDEFNPPSEEKIRAIAAALGQDADELLALARVIGPGRHYPAPPARDGDIPAGSERPVRRGNATLGRGGAAAQGRGRHLIGLRLA
jgi:transcriptional regulator with XRE-family HTH domain